MSPRVLLANKLRLASFGVACTLFASAVMPGALAYAASSAATNSNANTEVPAQDIASALEHAKGKVAAPVTGTTNDSHTPLKAAIGGASVTVPNNARDGVTLGAPNNGLAVNVQLPNASQDGAAEKVADGVVAYAGANGSANAVQATADGGAQFLTVIDNPSAPTAYDYKITVPNGGKIELTTNGGAVVLDKHSKPLALIATPWATDATGKAITTYFTTDGQTLTQHIEHNVPGVVYPVTADPWWSWKWWGVIAYLSRTETNFVAWGVGGVGVIFGWTGVAGGAAYAIATGAAWATSHGYCLAVSMTYWNWPFGVYPWVYNC